MSHIHFTATEEYRNRVIQMGESPDRVFYTGTPGLDNIDRIKLLTKEEFEKSIDFNIGDNSFLVTFHPVTLESDTASEQFDELIGALEIFHDFKIIFTMPNADTEGRIIIDKIQKFVSMNPERAVAFVSMGQLRYLSALKHVKLVIGNSSSGLTEAPSFKIPTVNIGDRQKGRIKANSVISCSPERNEIENAIKLGLSMEFSNSVKNVVNPYGNPGASLKIVDLLKVVKLDNILKKEFYNL
jgi:GDP/UDP-N,N'-diacetylbacillosamine 2-epimerase (hydrolysing)